MNDTCITMELDTSQDTYIVAGSTNEWQQNYTHNSNCSDQIMDFQVDETLSLFPFVCGLCFEKFDNISVYYNHLNGTHKEAQRYFHSSQCSRDRVASEMQLFSCGKCSYASPSLCQLHEHLVEREHTTVYQLVTDNRTAYPCSVKEEVVDDQDISTETCTVQESHSATQVSGKELCQNPDLDTVYVKLNKFTKEISISQADVKTRLRTTVDLEKHTIQTLNKISEKISKNRKSAQPLQNKKTKSSVMDDEIPESALQNVTTEHHEILIGDDIKDKKNPLDRLDSEHQNNKTDYINEKKHSNHIKEPVESDTFKPDSSSSIKLEEVFSESENHPITSDSPCVDDGCEPVAPGRAYIPCDRCGLAVRKNTLKEHMATHSDVRNFPCELCSSRFKTRRQLRIHKKNVHVEENTAICQDCGKAFKNASYLRQHKMIHTEYDKKCPHCPATFNNTNILKRHIMGHSGERPWRCTWPSCDRRYARSDDLARHRLTHTGNSKKFECPRCHKLLTRKDHLNNHVRRMHPEFEPESL